MADIRSVHKSFKRMRRTLLRFLIQLVGRGIYFTAALEEKLQTFYPLNFDTCYQYLILATEYLPYPNPSQMKNVFKRLSVMVTCRVE